MGNRSSLARIRLLVAGVVLGIGVGVFASAATALADDPPYHVLSAEDLCDLIWRGSHAVSDPQKFGTVCIRQDGLLAHLAKVEPTLFSNKFHLEPGSAEELPVGSLRVDPKDPLSAWIIPDCSIPGQIDCQSSA